MGFRMGFALLQLSGFWALRSGLEKMKLILRTLFLGRILSACRSSLMLRNLSSELFESDYAMTPQWCTHFTDLPQQSSPSAVAGPTQGIGLSYGVGPVQGPDHNAASGPTLVLSPSAVAGLVSAPGPSTEIGPISEFNPSSAVSPTSPSGWQASKTAALLNPVSVSSQPMDLVTSPPSTAPCDLGPTPTIPPLPSLCRALLFWGL
ncbi:hypothetical protein Salat_1200500 [Sesamum alatum]|uniref:Uncharacterized protein n=1 Tax=Sesamum alatum TaxID=300844 RepID=A0AAE2CNS9_9LAMI|nr:hypothetical protein Salat_1200500 [Sesamum alatum]